VDERNAVGENTTQHDQPGGDDDMLMKHRHVPLFQADGRIGRSAAVRTLDSIRNVLSWVLVIRKFGKFLPGNMNTQNAL
jgi:hypothetical protein